MLLKKIALIGSALTITALPLIANADLVTCNWTSDPSTVKIMSSPLPAKPCSSAFKDGVTPSNMCLPGKPIMAVKTICGAPRGGNCFADVYASANCTGTLVGKVQINLDSPAMKVTVLSENPNYHIQITGTSKVDIYQIKK